MKVDLCVETDSRVALSRSRLGEEVHSPTVPDNRGLPGIALKAQPERLRRLRNGPVAGRVHIP
jgi:hypothetical protein